MGRRRRYATASEPAPIDLNPVAEPVLDFPNREFGDLGPADYARLGFMCGLEVHQQLITDRKLFCRCPAGLKSDRVDAEVLRHMRPTLSELGEYDGCALMEFKTKKEILYLLEQSTVCTYEMDDTPPFEIDAVAVKRALEVSKMFDMSLVSELQVMRKQYLDGSIPTGFQRTAMVGLGGEIPMRESELGPRTLRIRQLTLEEDSCREVSDFGHYVTFRTDRLGTPLIETVTEPDLLTPNDVAVGGRLLAAVARASGKVRRGPGAARQDVNVSIAGSRRVEIKGIANHHILPLLVHIEAYRHLELLRLRQALRERGLTKSDFVISDSEDAWASSLVADVRKIMRGANFLPVVEARARGEFVAAVRVPGFAGLLTHRTQPGRTFLHEIAERVRVIACLVASPFLIASDNHRDALFDSVWRELRTATGASKDDAVVLVWGPEDDVDTAAREILTRAADALVGVPSETRQGHADGTTGFERILPGPERMYPDTDTPPLPIPDAWLHEIDEQIAPRPWEREDRFVDAGVPLTLARPLAAGRHAAVFEAIAPRTPRAARRLASALVCRVSRLADVDATRIEPIVRALESGELYGEAFGRAFDVVHDGADAAAVLARFAPPPDATALLDDAEAWIDAARAGIRTKNAAAARRYLMGLVMRELLGRVHVEAVSERVEAAL